MKQRTQNSNCKAFQNYGARGITVCAEWQDFESFCEWAKGNGYKRGLDLDRVDNNKGYYPENCRWATRRENVNNRRVTLAFTVNGKTKACSEWAEETHIPHGTLKVWSETKGHAYVEKRIQDALKNGYTPRNYANAHSKAIRKVKTGMVYRSVREAALENGISASALSTAMTHNNGITKAGAFEWEEIK